MEWGIEIPTFGRLADPATVATLARAAEDLGFDSIWVADHIVFPPRIESRYPYSADGEFLVPPDTPFLDPLVTLGYFAALTSRSRLGLTVLILPYRNPVVTAKMLATIDQYSQGRLRLGIGVGWMKEEFDALAVPFDDRGKRTDEYVEIFRTIWTDPTPSYAGQTYRFAPIKAEPKTVQPGGPPIYVGGNANPALRRAARLSNGWHANRLTPEAYRDHRRRLDDFCRSANRDPAEVPTVFKIGIRLVDQPGHQPDTSGRTLSGSPDQIAAGFEPYRQAGIDSFVTPIVTADADEFRRVLERLAREVRPRLEAAATAP